MVALAFILYSFTCFISKGFDCINWSKLIVIVTFDIIIIIKIN